MGNLYLVDQPFGENALALAKDDREAKVVLLQDGVNLDITVLSRAGIKVYAIRQDVQKRGVSLPAYIQIIDYGQLVDLILENKVINFA